MVIVVCCLCIIGPGLFFVPHMVPLKYLGPVGPLYRFFIRVGIWHEVIVTALSLHFFEAIYSWHLCRRKGIEGSARVKWLVSTALFGGTSLYELNRYKPVLHGAN
ncbi:uncharacterized membrane protein C688.16-like [Patiria miniata]|uniref:Transmembrane protein 254 n=1 Tax=Patiria miniata TaxID=46514 RepID=A0A913ZFM3_PATMI|nr:uncharacterized membrane protein C688.16-like [Patiria miniata]